MKIVRFPKPGDADGPDVLAAQLDAALYGERSDSHAEAWRELRDDVRTLAQLMSPEFERDLWERIEARASVPRQARRQLAPRVAFARVQTWVGSGLGPRLIALGGICAMAAIVVLAVMAPWRSEHIASESFSGQVGIRGTAGSVPRSSSSAGDSTARSSEATPVIGRAVPLEPAAAGGSAPARVQQRAATLTLAPKPEAVQSVADQVAQLAARDGGFVQSSQVYLQRGSGGEANLQLSVPSARLSAALAELARLAPTRAQSQSLQDITDEYTAARTKLSDAVAERQALLRALAKASTQGQIESLHARLSLVGGNIVKDRAAFAAVSKRGSNSTVEVTVLGDKHAGGGDSTLTSGLHDAADVLKAALAVLIVALAVLVPLAVLAVLAAIAWRASRRRLRERALS